MGKLTKVFNPKKLAKPSIAFGSGMGTGAIIDKNVPIDDQTKAYLGLTGAGLAARQAVANKKIQKLLTKRIGKKLAMMPLKGVAGPAAAGLWAKDIYDMGGPAISKAMAKSFGKEILDDLKKDPTISAKELKLITAQLSNYTPEAYRKQMGSLFSKLKPSEAAKARKEKRKKTKARIQKGQIPKKLKGGFRASRKDILKSIGRKKGGRVGRPRGVGAALRGYGKAMKNG